MKTLLGLTVLALALLNAVGAHQSSSMEDNAVQNDLPITNIMPTGLMKQRFRRETTCEAGQRWIGDLKRCCKKCQAGSYMAAGCTRNQETRCEHCAEGEFTDAENTLSHCRRCTQCQKQNGQEKETRCHPTYDTICTCRENFFCQPKNSSATCEPCLSCKSCNEETEEIAQHCTKTKDTVCTKKGSKSLIAGVVVGLLIILAALLGVLVYLYRKGILPCNRKPEVMAAEYSALMRAPNQPEPQVPDVPDINLSEMDLQLIVEEIEPKIYHELGIKLGLDEPKLQQLEADYRDDTKRQGYNILYSWLQVHGKKGAFPQLIDVLRKARYTAVAENIMKKMNVTEECITGTAKLDGSENGKAADSEPVA